MSKSARIFSISFILLFTTLLIIKPQIIQAAGQGMNIGEYDTEKGNQDRKTTIDAAEKGQTLIHGQNTQEFMLGSLVFNTTNMIVCTDPDTKYCNPQKTAMGNISLAMQAIYTNPPASLAWYTRDLAVNMGLIKPSYAQGIGFAGLSPLLGIWKATRNMSYAVLVIVMVAIGFMIIFRTKIDPKTVISVQAALPKIVVTLILITFSYPIVGFLIDIMYLSMAVIIGIIGQGFNLPNTAQLQTDFMGGTIFTLLFMVFDGGLGWDKIGAFAGSFGSAIGIGSLGGVLGTPSLLNIFNSVSVLGIPGLGNAILGGAAVAGIILLIIVLGLLFTYIRLLMLLFNSYIQVLLSLLLAPILLLREAIPGQSAFGEWILTVMANLVVFPATAAILIFAMTITKLFAATDNVWSPPLAGMPNGMFGYFVGLSIIFTSPNMVISIKKLFNPKPATPISAGSPLTPVTGAVGTGMGAASQFYYFKSLIDTFQKKPQHQQ